MKLSFPGKRFGDPRQIIRRCGYGEIALAHNGVVEVSYTRRLTGNLYPRYHAYLEKTPDGGFQVNLHLDQKQASYSGHTAHNGEYDGELVEAEGARIHAIIDGMKSPLTPVKPRADF